MDRQPFRLRLRTGKCKRPQNSWWLPSDATDEKSGGTDGVIGIRYLYLNYENPFNYFGTIGLSVNTFTDSEDLDSASDREDLSSGSASELTFTGYVLSGGVTYNANQ